MDIEQRFVIRFLIRKNLTKEDIIAELQNTYGDDAYSQSSIYFWIGEIKRGRTDLFNLPSPGRPVDDQIDTLIQKELENDPFVSARIIARRIRVAISTVTTHLHKSLKMKNVHFRWIPHLLTEQQKKMRVELSNEILKALEIARKNKFKFILTGDESWFEYAYAYQRMWVFQDDTYSYFTAPTDIQKKIMVTIFLNGDGLQFIDLKPQGVKINAEYFLHNIIQKLENLDVTNAAKKQKQTMLLHYDNAPSHNANMVTNYLIKTTFRKVPHPPYSPDLAICDFGVFGTAKNYMQGKRFGTEEALLSELNKFFREKPKEFYFSLFESWIERLHKCIDIGGDYVE